MYRINSSIALTLIMFLTALGYSGCGSKPLEMSSKWCDREVIIDGKNLEWDGGITYLDDPNVAIGQFNDDKYLYLQLSSWDMEIVRHVMGSGFTVWFDPKGGKEKVIGIHYPIGHEGKGPPKGMELEKGEMGESRDLLSIMESQMQELEILSGEDTEPVRLSISEAETLGIGVSIGFNQRTLVYEMKMSLIRDANHPFGVGVDPLKMSEGEQIKTIGVGIETSELDMPEFKEGMGEPPGGGEGMSGGMSGGPPGGGPPSGGGKPGGGPKSKPASLNFWFLLSLAPRP
jgi:hypothetical protein